jgi:hypothetical protein
VHEVSQSLQDYQAVQQASHENADEDAAHRLVFVESGHFKTWAGHIDRRELSVELVTAQ